RSAWKRRSSGDLNPRLRSWQRQGVPEHLPRAQYRLRRGRGSADARGGGSYHPARRRIVRSRDAAAEGLRAVRGTGGRRAGARYAGAGRVCRHADVGAIERGRQRAGSRLDRRD
ncbi:hypothetical protein LTR94_034881, partial [Friedmanniomyces endolithicus]